MNTNEIFKWAIAITGTIGALAAYQGLIPGKYGAAIGTVAIIALNLNRSLLQIQQKQDQGK